jgi:hypothetical protein
MLGHLQLAGVDHIRQADSFGFPHRLADSRRVRWVDKVPLPAFFREGFEAATRVKPGTGTAHAILAAKVK